MHIRLRVTTYAKYFEETTEPFSNYIPIGQIGTYQGDNLLCILGLMVPTSLQFSSPCQVMQGNGSNDRQTHEPTPFLTGKLFSRKFL